MSIRTLYQGNETSDGWTALRALHYGDGVFRSMLLRDGHVIDWPRHYRKLAADADRIDLQAPAVDLLESEIAALIRGVTPQDGVIKLLLSRAPGERGYAPTTREAHRLLTLSPLPTYPATHWSQGINVAMSEVRVSRHPQLAGIKHLNRLEQVLASRNWAPGQQEALMCNGRGEVVCGTRSNVFFWREHTLITPDLSESGICGLMRDKLMSEAVLLGLPCEVRRIPQAELAQVEECFITNSVIGVWPVRSLNGRELTAPGPVACELMRRLAHPWNGH